MAFQHIPVLFHETIDSLQIRPDGVYIDGTAGGGGHSQAILDRLQTGLLLSIDQDPDAIAVVTKRFEGNPCSLVRQANFADMARVAAEAGISRADGVLLDIGVSSYQLDTPERGFSYQSDAPLDMRMDRTQALTAREVVNSYSEQQLREIIGTYGEERYAGRIAAAIAARRKDRPIETTAELSEIVRCAMPAAARREKQHPAKRTFQAVRIEVNGELSAVQTALDRAVPCLAAGGRLAVISFHSLEDRIVKQTFAQLAKGCICPKEFPVCVCGRKPQVRLIDRGGVTADEQEILENPRARSARLRTAEKI